MASGIYRSLGIDYNLDDFDSLDAFLDVIYKAAFTHYSCVFEIEYSEAAEYYAIKSQDNAEVFWNYNEFNEASR